MEYIEYKHRGKCIYCNDPIWVENDEVSIICKCTNASIEFGIKNNCTDLTDEDMLEYLNNERISDYKIIKI